MLIVDSVSFQRSERSTAQAISSSTAAALITVSGGMMDVGWCDVAAPSLFSIVAAHVRRDRDDGEDALASALETQLTELERAQKWRCTIGFVLVRREEDAAHPLASWRVTRIGGARVYAVRGRDTTIVGTEDAFAFPGGETVVTAGLSPRVRWRSERHGWVLCDEAELAPPQRAMMRTATVAA